MKKLTVRRKKEIAPSPCARNFKHLQVHPGAYPGHPKSQQLKYPNALVILMLSSPFFDSQRTLEQPKPFRLQIRHKEKLWNLSFWSQAWPFHQLSGHKCPKKIPSKFFKFWVRRSRRTDYRTYQWRCRTYSSRKSACAKTKRQIHISFNWFEDSNWYLQFRRLEHLDRIRKRRNGVLVHLQNHRKTLRNFSLQRRSTSHPDLL